MFVLHSTYIKALRDTLAPPAQFTQEEIATLIRLCHPDKHNNSTTSNNITQRLLQLRKE